MTTKQISTSDPQYFRLRGTIDGQERIFPLPVGIHTVGFSRQCDLVIRADGVSRRHARLTASPGLLMVEDLKSTNGTKVNGKRVGEARVPVGAELAFGPAPFQVEPADPEQAELAISLPMELGDFQLPRKPGQPGPKRVNGSEDREPSTVLIEERHSGEDESFTSYWLEGIEKLFARVPPRGRHSDKGEAANLEPALAFLGNHLFATPNTEAREAASPALDPGCCLVEWGPADAQPVVTATWGQIRTLPALSEAREWWRAAARPAHLQPPSSPTQPTPSSGDFPRVAFLATTPPISAVLRLAPDAGSFIPIPARALVIWGSFPGRLASASFLRPALSILAERLDRVREHQPHDEPAENGSNGHSPKVDRPSQGLIIPEHYRPGTSPLMLQLYDRMQRLARRDLPILITGETGVGKELVARILHDSSPRAQGPFIAVNCAALPADLLEADMFGIGKGVATGVDAREGFFQKAQGGTFFLDEIGEMHPSLQAKLLRVLQEKEIQPLGCQPRAIDVRVIAATNVRLEQALAEGILRRDLYYRLARSVLEVPPLRHCPSDFDGLVDHFLRRFSRESRIAVRGLTISALQALREHDWPGNIRELKNFLELLVSTSNDGEILDDERVRQQLRRDGEAAADAAPASAFDVENLPTLDLAVNIEMLERKIIAKALELAGGVKVRAARILGLSRNGLDKKMKRLGIQGDP